MSQEENADDKEARSNEVWDMIERSEDGFQKSMESGFSLLLDIVFGKDSADRDGLEV